MGQVQSSCKREQSFLTFLIPLSFPWLSYKDVRTLDYKRERDREREKGGVARGISYTQAGGGGDTTSLC